MKRKLRNLKLRAIAVVDNPCQEHALALTIKRYGDDEDDKEPDQETLDLITKYVCENDGAHSFAEVLRENKFSQEIWPCVDALSQSIRSIVGDKSLTGAAREENINSSVGEFLARVNAISPDVSKRLGPLVRKEVDMDKLQELTAKVEELTGQVTSAQALATSEKARADTSEAALVAEKAAHVTTKAALVVATEETIKVGETEIKKSEAGETQFAVLKAMRDERDMVTFEKRAEVELSHVVGTAAEKAQVLKHVDALPADSPTRKAFEAIMGSAEKMAAQGFATLGTRGGDTPTSKAAVAKFEEEVAKVVAADNCTHTEAMSKVRRDNPDLFAEYQGA